MRCSATTAKGEPCRRNAMTGTTLCAAHVRGRKPGDDTELLTDSVTERLTAMLRAGNYDEVAARAAGVSIRTFYRWLERGKAGEPGYVELAERVEKARAEGEAVHVARISQASTGDWHASAWFLERSYPERWGKVSPRPFDPARESPAEGEPVTPGLFAEVDELARRRAQRTA